MLKVLKKYILPLVNIYRRTRASRTTCLVTTFKDRFELMEFFVNYYSRYWKIKKFVFLMGWTDFRNVELIKERIARIAPHAATVDSINIPPHPESYLDEIVYDKAEASTESVSIDLLYYHFPPNMTVEGFKTAMRPLLRNMPMQYLDAKYSRIFMADYDEFYYSPSPDATLLKGWEIFHFLEYVPYESFSAGKDWRWCIQGWYYSQKLEEVFRKGLFCLHCKYIKFDRHNPHFGHCGNAEGGASCRRIKNTPLAGLNLLKENICFHFSVPGRAELYTEKIQQGYITSSNIARLQNKELIFSEPKFPVITENFLKKYYVAKP